LLDNLFQHKDIINEPIFYLFIAATLIITIGYSWGVRRNKKIYLSAFKALVNLIKPKDQQFTNIGGVTGYHANLIPKRNDIYRRVDATITLLPRQSWLYLPFSLIIQRFDRLFIIFFLTPRKKAGWILKEGHIIERKYSKFRSPKIMNAEKLNEESFNWDGNDYILYYEDEAIKKKLLALAARMGSPGTVKHIAVVPEEERIFTFMIPGYDSVEKNLKPIFNWIRDRQFAVEQNVQSG